MHCPTNHSLIPQSELSRQAQSLISRKDQGRGTTLAPSLAPTSNPESPMHYDDSRQGTLRLADNLTMDLKVLWPILY
jgi:hypothetical protein